MMSRLGTLNTIYDNKCILEFRILTVHNLPSKYMPNTLFKYVNISINI